MHTDAYVMNTFDQQLNQVYEKAANFFNILAEPTRLKIMHVLCSGEQSVNTVMQQVELSQSNISRHLAAMCRHGVLERRKEGVTVYYKIKDEQVVNFCRSICVDIAMEMDVSKVILPSNKKVKGASIE